MMALGFDEVFNQKTSNPQALSLILYGKLGSSCGTEDDVKINACTILED